MRTRLKGYTDYGMTRSDVENVKKYCREHYHNKELFLRCARSVNPDIADILVYSVAMKRSFEICDARFGVPYGKGDFYGYRRKYIAEVHKSMKEMQ